MNVNLNAYWKLLISISCIIASLTAPRVASASTEIQGDVSADNSFALYTGNRSKVKNFWGGGDDWGEPVNFDFRTSDSILYIAAWSDDWIAQGLLQDLTANGNSLFGPNVVWDVFATGIDLDRGNSRNPSLAELTEQINIANANAGDPNTTSVGWVSAKIGDGNGVGPWGKLDSIDDAASWMWYDSGKQGRKSVFRRGFKHHEYLIFRIRVPKSNGIIVILAMSALGLGKLSRPSDV